MTHHEARMCERARRKAETSGPRALMLAVLEDAVRCIEEARRRRRFHARRLAAEAEAWMRSEHRGRLFSFLNICEVLELDVDAVRARFLTRAQRPRTRLDVRVDAPRLEGKPCRLPRCGSRVA